MNPRFDTTMRTAFRDAAVKAISEKNPPSGARLDLLTEVSKSFDRGVGAPRQPRRDR